eukprot:3602494-Rhodomonas_salina.7
MNSRHTTGSRSYGFRVRVHVLGLKVEDCELMDMGLGVGECLPLALDEQNQTDAGNSSSSKSARVDTGQIFQVVESGLKVCVSGFGVKGVGQGLTGAAVRWCAFGSHAGPGWAKRFLSTQHHKPEVQLVCRVYLTACQNLCPHDPQQRSDQAHSSVLRIQTCGRHRHRSRSHACTHSRPPSAHTKEKL